MIDKNRYINFTSHAIGLDNKKPLLIKDVFRKFREKFPKLEIEDYRPYRKYKGLYVWLNGPVNLIVVYHEETDSFEVLTTKEPWDITQA